jgi:hypothetical protein
MTKASDNIFPKVTFLEGAAPSSPSASDFHLYFDSADHLLKWKNSAGAVTTIATGTSGLSDQGVITYLDGTVAAAPGTPAAGKLRIYAKTGKVFAVKDDAGVETVLTAASAGALVLLEQHTASASSSLDFTTFISATYDTYLIKGVEIIAATSTANLLLRVGTGGGPTYDAGNNYEWAATGRDTNGTAYADSGSVLASIRIFKSMSTTAGYGFGTFSLTASGLQSTAIRKVFHGTAEWVDTVGPNANYVMLGGSWDTTGTAATALRFVMSSGNITSGTIRIYGVAK